MDHSYYYEDDPAEENYDEEDEDLVVYKEQFVPFHHQIMSTSVNQSSQPSHSQKEGLNKNKNVPGADSPPSLVCRMPRRERKRRRQEWRARQLADAQQCSSSPSPQHDFHDPNEFQLEDAFASLQSLLRQQQQEEKCVEKELGDCSDEEPTTVDDKKKSGCVGQDLVQQKMEKPTTHSQQTEEALIPVDSEVMMDVPTDDDDDDDDGDGDDNDNEEKKTEEPFVPAISTKVTLPRDRQVSSPLSLKDNSKSSSIENAMKRRRFMRREKFKEIRNAAPTRTMPKPKFHVSPSSKTHAKSKSHRIRSGDGNEKLVETAPSTSSSSKLGIRKNMKSIVRSRPIHWSKNLSKKGGKTAAHTSPRFQRLAKAAAVAAATRSPFRHKVRPKKLKKSKLTSSVGSPSSHKKSPSRPYNSIKKKQQKRVRSFAPVFARTARSESLDQVEDVPDDDDHLPHVQAFRTSPVLPLRQTSPPTKELSSKEPAGPLATRLALLRKSLGGDSLRLNSGQYSFPSDGNSTFHVNDPRQKAKSHCDVTILGEPCVSKLDEEESKLMVVGFVHGYHATKETNEDILRSPDPRGFFCLVCFTMGTARSINVRRGIQLRIYNSIIIPCRGLLRVKDRPSTGNGKLFKIPICDHLMLCTYLCELYPSRVLPPLPSANEILSISETAKDQIEQEMNSDVPALTETKRCEKTLTA